MIAKLANGKNLAAFTEISFENRSIPEPNPRAFLCDLNREKFYKPKNMYKTICYDKNFILFGNSEIRIKHKDNKIYSNFAIAKSFFDPEEDKLHDFIGRDNLVGKR